jgi:hypothetical protein
VSAAQQHLFDGRTFSAERDGARLSCQLAAVRGYMLNRYPAWATLEQIAEAIGNASLPGISARLRDLRKPRFGGYTVERRYVEAGLWEYRVQR